MSGLIFLTNGTLGGRERALGLPENLDALLARFGITQEELAQIAGVTPGAVSGWKRGARPRDTALANICAHFGLSTDALISDAHGLASEASVDALAASVKGTPTRTVPVQIPQDRAGLKPKGSQCSVRTRIAVPEFVVSEHPSAFAYRLTDSSMSKVIPQGAYVVVDPNSQHPQNGALVALEICDFSNPALVWNVRSTVLFRTWFKGANKVLLAPQSHDLDYEDIVVDFSEIGRSLRLLGTVIWYQPSDTLA